MNSSEADARPEIQELFQHLKTDLQNLEVTQAECNEMWGYEDAVYRFYHQSFKVYSLQEATKRIVAQLRALAPERKMNGWFLEIVALGTNRQFTVTDNQRWLEATRPILEAFCHAKYFLDMSVKYGHELAEPPAMLPSGLAALLYLYGLR